MTQIESFESRLPTSSPSPEAVFEALEATLTENSDFHRLFDVRLMKVRQQMNLPVTQPTSLSNVPRDQETRFREAYVSTARDIGTMFLKSGRLPDAWAYFRTIGEPEPVREALEKISIPAESSAEFDEIMNLALYEGAHVVRGLQFLLKTHGTCNTITAMSQLMQQMSPAERRGAAAIMVRHLYTDLQYSVRRDVESREPGTNPPESIRELIAGRDFLFADGNYHIDVSHLHAVAGFARNLSPGDPELAQAVELCEYGRKLSSQLQYPGDVPFDRYYEASHHFLKALNGQDQDQAIAYFTERLRSEPDLPDQKLIAFVLVDLAQRIDRVAEVLPAAAEFLGRLEDPNGFSFIASCLRAGCNDLLRKTARENDDIIAMATALLAQTDQK